MQLKSIADVNCGTGYDLNSDPDSKYTSNCGSVAYTPPSITTKRANGAHANIFEGQVEIIPNSADLTARLKLLTPLQSELRIDILDVLGNKMIASINETTGIGNNEFTLPVQNLPSGTYFVRIEGSSGAKMVRLIILH